jgi:hypothetical protein
VNSFDSLSTAVGSLATLSKNISVNQLLTLGSDLVTGANVLTMAASASSTGSADVIGNVKRSGLVTGGSRLTFGNPFNSISFDAGGILPTDITVNLTKSVPAGFSDAVQRTYVITQNGGSGFSATLRLHYRDSELNGNSEPRLNLYRLNGVWELQGSDARNLSDNWVEKTGVTQFSTWTFHSDSQSTIRSPFDFDGDGKTDIGITRPNGGIKEWWISRSSDSNVFSTVFGVDSDISAPADFTGDGKTDIAVFRPSNGNWFILRSEDFTFLAFPFGTNGDIPMPADYDGDGKADTAVYRPSNSTWFIPLSGGGGTTIAQFGAAGVQPVAAN